MKRFVFGALFGLALIPVISYAEAPRDWHDIVTVHDEIINSLARLDRVDTANYGEAEHHLHEAKEHLRMANRELQAAIDVMKRRP